MHFEAILSFYGKRPVSYKSDFFHWKDTLLGAIFEFFLFQAGRGAFAVADKAKHDGGTVVI